VARDPSDIDVGCYRTARSMVAGGQTAIDGKQTPADIYNPTSGTFAAANVGTTGGFASATRCDLCSAERHGTVLIAGGRQRPLQPEHESVYE